MEQSSTDRRVRKTKKQLRLALMELLAEKSAKSISVRELTERADINRGTFYTVSYTHLTLPTMSCV